MGRDEYHSGVTAQWAGLWNNTVLKSPQLETDANGSEPIEPSQLSVTHKTSHSYGSVMEKNGFKKNLIWFFLPVRVRKTVCCISFEASGGGVGLKLRSDSVPLMPSRDPAVIACNLLQVLPSHLPAQAHLHRRVRACKHVHVDLLCSNHLFSFFFLTSVSWPSTEHQLMVKATGRIVA